MDRGDVQGFVACCKRKDETNKARRYRFLKQSKENETYLLPGTKEKPIVQVDGGRNYYPTSFKLLSLALLSVDRGRNYYPTSFKLLSLVLLSKNHEKVLPGTSLFHPKASVSKPNQVKGKLAPTTPTINYPAPHILQMDKGVGGAAGAVALATLAEKNEEKGVRDEILEQL